MGNLETARDLGQGIYTQAETDSKVASAKSAVLKGSFSLSNTVLTAGMATHTYTGTGIAQAIDAGVDLATQWGDNEAETYGGLVWDKSRSSTYANALFDTIRGANQAIVTNTTAAEANYVNSISFNNNGFTTGSSATTNNNTTTYASWIFQTTHRLSATQGSTELITGDDSTFTSTVGNWVAGSGTFVSTASEGVLTGAGAYASLNITTVADTTYTFMIDVTDNAGNGGRNLYIRAGSTGANSFDLGQINNTVEGKYILSFKATTTTTTITLLIDGGSGGETYTVDNASLKENHTPTNHGKYWESHYNPVTGFTMVKYEGSGIAGHEIPHKLGRELAFVTAKCLTTVTNWMAESKDYTLALNLTNAGDSSVRDMLTNSDFGILQGSASNSNASGDSYIMYGWANSFYDDAGELNGSYYTYADVDGSGNQILHLTVHGNQRENIMWEMNKTLNVTGDWNIIDYERGTTAELNANLSNAESVITANTLVNTASPAQYAKASETSNITVTDCVVSYSNGVSTTGADNSIENVGSTTFTSTSFDF